MIVLPSDILDYLLSFLDAKTLRLWSLLNFKERRRIEAKIFQPLILPRTNSYHLSDNYLAIHHTNPPHITVFNLQGVSLYSVKGIWYSTSTLDFEQEEVGNNMASHPLSLSLGTGKVQELRGYMRQRPRDPPPYWGPYLLKGKEAKILKERGYAKLLRVENQVALAIYPWHYPRDKDVKVYYVPLISEELEAKAYTFCGRMVLINLRKKRLKVYCGPYSHCFENVRSYEVRYCIARRRYTMVIDTGIRLELYSIKV